MGVEESKGCSLPSRYSSAMNRNQELRKVSGSIQRGTKCPRSDLSYGKQSYLRADRERPKLEKWEGHCTPASQQKKEA